MSVGVVLNFVAATRKDHRMMFPIGDSSTVVFDSDPVFRRIDNDSDCTPPPRLLVSRSFIYTVNTVLNQLSQRIPRTIVGRDETTYISMKRRFWISQQFIFVKKWLWIGHKLDLLTTIRRILDGLLTKP